MAEYTTRNRLVKQATNENKGTWGAVLNVGLIDTVDFAIDGVLTLALTGDVVLTTADGAPDEARARTIFVSSTGGANRTITIPAVEKWYHVINDGANIVTVKTATGVGAVVLPGDPGAPVSALVLCDGLDCRRVWQSEYGLLSTTAFTPASEYVNLPLTGFGYNNFKIRVKGASVSAVPSVISLAMSSDGVNYSTAGLGVAVPDNASDTLYGEIDIPNALAPVGLIRNGLVHLSGDNTAGSDQYVSGVGRTPTQAITIPWRLSGGIKHVRLTVNSAGSAVFDGGSFEVWAK